MDNNIDKSIRKLELPPNNEYTITYQSYLGLEGDEEHTTVCKLIENCWWNCTGRHSYDTPFPSDWVIRRGDELEDKYGPDWFLDHGFGRYKFTIQEKEEYLFARERKEVIRRNWEKAAKEHVMKTVRDHEIKYYHHWK